MNQFNQSDLYAFDDRYRQKNGPLLCGVDEAGRGPLAGPVVAAAVILPADLRLEGLNDSKKLSEKKRERLFEEITRKAICHHIVAVEPSMIDKINILQATMLAMERAVSGLAQRPDTAVVDGNRLPKLPPLTRGHAEVKGDAHSASVAAASILAKVTRDRIMLQLAQTYPEYGFEQHKGYPTKAHYEALLTHGASPVHRMSFLKNLEEKRASIGRKTEQQERGAFGEQAALAFLEQKGYLLLDRNFRCKEGELDLVMRDGDCMVFVEVKARTGSSFGRPADAVRRQKQQRLIYAAERYMRSHEAGLHRFDVVEVYLTREPGGLRVLKIRHMPNLFTYNINTYRPEKPF